jgi:pimeloyl-ACP methyl ester carboxylesterase
MAPNTTYWRSPELGEQKELELRQGRLRYHDKGTGPPLVFVHGVLVNANLWRKVVARLSPDFRCVVLDMPIGAHEVPMPREADLSPPALGDVIADAIEALGLDDVTLVGNDTGGALSQIAVARHPQKIGRLVLTNCDAFENFPPKMLKPVLRVMTFPAAMPVLLAPTRLAAVRRRALKMMRAAKHPVEQEVVDSYALPPVVSAGVRRDVKKFFRTADNRYTLEAAERLGSFDRPALIAWAPEDNFFPESDARRLAQALPNARLEWIEDSYIFSPEDQPGKLAELIGSFMREPAAAS